MKWFKKLIAITLAAVLALAMLTACGGTGKEGTEADLGRGLQKGIGGAGVHSGGWKKPRRLSDRCISLLGREEPDREKMAGNV